MEEIKLNGQYKKEDGKRIMRLINEIKLRSMRLAKIVDEIDMPIIANIMAMRLCQYAAEKEVERSAKEVGGLEDKFLQALMIAERDNTLTTVEEVGDQSKTKTTSIGSSFRTKMAKFCITETEVQASQKISRTHA